MELVAGGLEAEGAEEGGEFELGEAAVGVHVESHEDVLQLLQLIGSERGHHYCNGGREEEERDREIQTTIILWFFGV